MPGLVPGIHVFGL